LYLFFEEPLPSARLNAFGTRPLPQSASLLPWQIVLSVFVTVSRLELALILLVRVLKRGGDSRFDDKRDFLPFLGFWIFQMVRSIAARLLYNPT
jgi:hypothetical protein